MFFTAPRDVQLSFGFLVSDMEYACLCLCWIQVVSNIVFDNVISSVFSNDAGQQTLFV